MQLAEIGSFHAGGKHIDVDGEITRKIWFTPDVSFNFDPNGRYIIEQCYVQFFVPTNPAGDLPVVLVHGGGQCGSVWERTPDGRPGWLQRLLEANITTYVVDNVERGRAGFNASPRPWPDEPIMRTEREAWDLFRFGPPGSYPTQETYAGCQFPVANLDALTRQSTPRWTSTTPAAVAALESALEVIGPCAIVAHSQGGAIANTVALKRPDLVKALVGVEASGFPEPVPASATQTRWLWVLGDYLQHDATARFLEQGAINYNEQLTNYGADSSVLRTTDLGSPGNTHMMMMDQNSDDIVAAIRLWLALGETPATCPDSD